MQMAAKAKFLIRYPSLDSVLQSGHLLVRLSQARIAISSKLCPQVVRIMGEDIVAKSSQLYLVWWDIIEDLTFLLFFPLPFHFLGPFLIIQSFIFVQATTHVLSNRVIIAYCVPLRRDSLYTFSIILVWNCLSVTARNCFIFFIFRSSAFERKR